MHPRSLGVLGPINEFYYNSKHSRNQPQDNDVPNFEYNVERCYAFKKWYMGFMKLMFLCFCITFYSTVVYTVVFNNIINELLNQINNSYASGLGTSILVYGGVTFVCCPFILICFKKKCSMCIEIFGALASIVMLITHMVVYFFIESILYDNKYMKMFYDWSCGGEDFFVKLRTSIPCYIDWNMIIIVCYMAISIFSFIFVTIKSCTARPVHRIL